MSSESTVEPSTWAEYIEGESKKLLEQVGPELALAFVHSRAIECPEYYSKSKAYKKDLASAHFGITDAGYWGRIAVRALVLLDVPVEEREKLIAEALQRERAAREAARKRIKKGPGGPYKEVDLSSLEI